MTTSTDLLFVLARKLGIDLDAHRCDCEVCTRTSAWCPASRSSVSLAIQEKARTSSSAETLVDVTAFEHAWETQEDWPSSEPLLAWSY